MPKIKVWVYPDAADEMQIFGTIIVYPTQGGIARVPATLTIPAKPKRKGK